MGPLATIDFLCKLVQATPAARDQDHIPLIVRFCPEVPDRVEALEGRGPSPERTLVRTARLLQRAGARCMVIPCNTAHLWHDAIAKALTIPILHIADATLAALPPGQHEPLGLLATSATLASGLYPGRRPGQWVLPSADETVRLVMPGIEAVKRGDVALGARCLEQAALRLVERGAGAIVMACTEIPVALAGRRLPVPMVDPTEALARASVEWALAPGAVARA